MVVKVQEKVVRTIISILLLGMYSVWIRNVRTEFAKYRIDIAAIQEVSWRGIGMLDTGKFILMCGGNGNNTFGTGFLIIREYKLTRMIFTFIPCIVILSKFIINQQLHK